MNLVFITANSIYDKSGGGIEAYKIHQSLKKISENDKNLNYSIISLDNDIKNSINSISIKKNKYKDLLSRFLFHSTYFYLDWLKIKSKIIELNPDIIILGNSRLGFIAKSLKKIINDLNIIVHFDNIELDYIKAYSLKYNYIVSSFYNKIEKIMVKRDEKNAIEYMDMGMFLTNRDLMRAKNIYKKEIKYKIIPICLKKDNKNLPSRNKYDLNLVFLGSLWYGSNIDGISWFLNNVWKNILKLNYNINLIIGGSNPSDELKNFLNTFENITTYYNFKNKFEIIPKNSVLISPIRSGAGMKVKVAEALSMGLGIIGSKETFIGYEEAINDKRGENVFNKANKSIDYINNIKKILMKNLEEEIRKDALYLFNKYYSLERSKKELVEILKTLTIENKVLDYEK